jgi:arginyl-tRNA synthetase
MAADGVFRDGFDPSRIAIEPPNDPAHGDVSTNAAMALSKQAGMKPRDLAEKLVARLGADGEIASAEIAGPGFVNLRLTDDFWRARIVDILRAGAAYGESGIGAGRAVNVEFVSANPTGPMHVGHGRGAVVGDALARLLAKAGFAVTKEYYINDAGAQVDALARSVHLRYRESLGENVGGIPEGLYPGAYLIKVGKALAERDGGKWRGVSEAEWLAPVRAFAIAAMMAEIRADLAAIGIAFDRFSSERELVEGGGVDAAIAALEQRGLIYTGVLEPPKGKAPDDWEPRPQMLFKATEFGDDVDRPVRKSDGSWTYFATDMAYHLDKVNRGFQDMIDVWGADHGGYVKRVQAAVKALAGEGGKLDVKLCQMVNLTDGGAPVKMSKRAGTFVTLRDVVERVGPDVVRFIMLTRRPDAQLEFDYAKVTEQSKDNPVFYVQYAHARCKSVLRHAEEILPGERLTAGALTDAPFDRLTDPSELALIKSMASWPKVVESAAEAHEPHRVAYYLHDLCSLFHGLWTRGAREDANLRFLTPADAQLTLARLGLVRALALVIASGLGVMGVEPLEELR